jgi:anti-anti-sigma regulatory factor
MKALLTRYQPRVVALDLSRVPDLEYSALQMLIEGDQRMRERGIELWVAALNPGVLEVARQSGLADQLGKERLLFNARQVIERYQANHGPDRDAPEQR